MDNLILGHPLLLLTFGLFFLSVFVYGDQFPYKNAALPIEERIDDLINRMTLEEKAFQISQLMIGRNDNPNNAITKKITCWKIHLCTSRKDPVYQVDPGWDRWREYNFTLRAK